MHPRAVIRQRVRALLADALDIPVVASRVLPWVAAKLPQVGVYTLLEDAERIDGQRHSRDLTMAVEIVSHKIETLDDDLDALADAAEDALLADPSLGLGRDNVEASYGGCEIHFSDKGDKLRGSVMLRFVVNYVTSHVPDVSGLDDFETADVEWRPNGATGQSPEVEDTITLPLED